MKRTCFLFFFFVTIMMAQSIVLSTLKQVCRQKIRPRALSSNSLLLSSAANDFTEILFDLELPEGRCVGVQLNNNNQTTKVEEEDWSDPNHWVNTCLHPEEVKYILDATTPVKKSFLLGRLAMRASLSKHELLQNDEPCLKDLHGRPTLPKGYVGSISHKGTIGVALSRKCSSSTFLTTVGVDIEQRAPKKRSIANKILTQRERDNLGNLKRINISTEEEVMLRFSLKEAIYKAVHPVINQYVGFQEAEVIPFENGTATVHWNLTNNNNKMDKLGIVTAHWKKIKHHFLTSASFEQNEEEEEIH